MNLREAESHLWAAFPAADEVIAKYMDAGSSMGLGVQLKGVRHALRYRHGRQDIHAAIARLGEMFAE